VNKSRHAALLTCPKKSTISRLPHILNTPVKKKRNSRLKSLIKKSIKQRGIANVCKKYVDRKTELRSWGRSMTFREKAFRKKFELLDTNLNKHLKLDAFKSVLRRIGAMSEKRLEEIVLFVDPDKSGQVPYNSFLELIAPLEPPRNPPRISAFALSKMSPVLAKCPVLLSHNPLRKNLHPMGRENHSYEYILNSGLKHRLERRKLIDPSKRRRDFELFLLKYQNYH